MSLVKITYKCTACKCGNDPTQGCKVVIPWHSYSEFDTMTDEYNKALTHPSVCMLFNHIVIAQWKETRRKLVNIDQKIIKKAEKN